MMLLAQSMGSTWQSQASNPGRLLSDLLFELFDIPCIYQEAW